MTNFWSFEKNLVRIYENKYFSQIELLYTYLNFRAKYQFQFKGQIHLNKKWRFLKKKLTENKVLPENKR